MALFGRNKKDEEAIKNKNNDTLQKKEDEKVASSDNIKQDSKELVKSLSSDIDEYLNDIHENKTENIDKVIDLNAKKQQYRPKKQNMPFGELAVKMFKNECDIYLILSRNTTLEQLETLKDISPFITTISKEKKLPAVRFSTDKELAEFTARHYGCVKEDIPLILKIRFEQLFTLLTDCVKAGIFDYVMNEGMVPYRQDKIRNFVEYVYKNLLEKNPSQFLQFCDMNEFLYKVKANSNKLYVYATNSAKEKDIKDKTFEMRTTDIKGNKIYPVFEEEFLAEKFMNMRNFHAKIVGLELEELRDKLTQIYEKNENKDFPILLGDRIFLKSISGFGFRNHLIDVCRQPKNPFETEEKKD